MTSSNASPLLATQHFFPGMRVAVACSGGADSVALLRTLVERREQLGVVLSVAHLNHGIRGAESDADQAFVAELAARLDLAFHHRRIDTPASAASAREGLEEAARRLRYDWFWELLAAGTADAVVTAHTLDDQAETVLHRLIRGAWTEGLSGIFPVLESPARTASKKTGLILRPFLGSTRTEIEAWLTAVGQPWRNDSSNADPAYTRNRIRHQLLPALAEYNPAIKRQLAQVAALARDEETYWQAELGRLLPSLLLPGKAVRGGGRATSTLPGRDSLSIEVERLRALLPALRRRVLRAAAAQLETAIDFDQTDRLLQLCGLEGNGEQPRMIQRKLQLGKGLLAERTPRELRLHRASAADIGAPSTPEYPLPIPGVVVAEAYGLRLEASVGRPAAAPLPAALLRASRPGDRVTLRHSRSALKVNEALRRMRLPLDRPHPVLEWQGEIVWMEGVPLESRVAESVVLLVTSSPLV